MFKKESKEYAIGLTYPRFQDSQIANIVLRDVEGAFQKGAEFGYNKVKEDADKMKSQFLELCNLKDMRIKELEKANKWHYVSEKGLPKKSGRYLVYVGGGENGVYPLDFDTEANDFGYWFLEVASASLGVTDTIFETITERNEDKAIAWKEIVLPEENK